MTRPRPAGAGQLRPAPPVVRGDDLPERPLRRYRRNVALLLVVAVPVVVDTSRFDVFALPKFTVLTLGATALLALWATSWAQARRAPLWRSGLQWPLAAVVGWTAVATAASRRPRLALWGLAHSWEGLLSTVAVAVVVVVIVEALDLRHLVLAARVLWYGAGGVVIVYGGLQLHDRVLGGSWDPVDWGAASDDRYGWIVSTLGNPNHAAGAIVVLVPVGLALLLTAQPWWARAATVALLVLGVAEVLYTTARGAWLALAAGTAVVGALLARDLWARRRALLPAAGAAFAVVLVVSLAVGREAPLGSSLASIFDPQGETTTERVEFWRSAWRIGVDHPVVGVGPELFAVPFNRYQSAAFARIEGAHVFGSGGPHNTFFNRLATQGFPGLALLLALLAVVALRAVGAHRRLARLGAGQKAPRRGPPLEARVLLAGLVASAVAYLVQASFNAEVLVLSSLFWVVVALIAVVALDAGVPDTLSPRALVASTPHDVVLTPAGVPLSRARLSAGPSSGGNRSANGLTIATATVVVALALVVGWSLTAPYRADTAASRAGVQLGLARHGASAGDPAAARAALARAFSLYEQAISLHPVEPRHHLSLAHVLVESARAELRVAPADPSAAGRAGDALRAARRHYRQAAELLPSAGYLAIAARGIAAIAELEPRGVDGLVDEAIATWRQAIRANPRSTWYRIELSELHQRRGEHDLARRLLEEARRLEPHRRAKVRILAELAPLYERDGRPAQAAAAWRELLEADPGNRQATAALRS